MPCWHLVVRGNPAGAVSENPYAWLSLWSGFLMIRWLQGGSCLHSDLGLQRWVSQWRVIFYDPTAEITQGLFPTLRLLQITGWRSFVLFWMHWVFVAVCRLLQWWHAGSAAAYGILVPQPGIKLGPPALGVQSFREVPVVLVFFVFFLNKVFLTKNFF